MKKLTLTILFSLTTLAASAQTYCATSAFGYGQAATGGGNATPTAVTSVSELQTALKASGSKVIIITKNITFTSLLKVKATNKTLMALPGVTLTSLQQNTDNSGILYFQNGSSNIILRNITFVGPGAYDCDGNDLLCFDGVTKAWVDHCDFQDGCDGNFDVKGNTDNLTVSWCRFHYLKTPKSGGSGGTDDHRFTNLIGSSSSDKPSDGTFNITWAYCWWDEGCVERMTRCRNASLHFLNCYWNSSVANYYVGPENADCLFDGCTFEGKPVTKKIFYQNYDGKNGAKFVGCTASKGLPTNVTDRTVVTPSYSYTTLAAATAKSAVSNTTCGAGATLTVTTAGAVSSTCDSGSVTPEPTTPDTTATPDPDSEGTEPEPDPDADTTPSTSDTVTVSTFWNMSDSDFNGLGDIAAETTVRKLHLVATSGRKMKVESSKKDCDDISFTHRLKLNGTGGDGYRQVAFSVKGACTIDVYLLSASSSEERPLKICQGAFDANVLTTLNAGTTLAKQSYTYTGDATTLRLYSADSGIHIYGIRVTYSNTATAIDNITANSDDANNENNANNSSNQRYNILGQPVDDTYHGLVIQNGKKYYQW